MLSRRLLVPPNFAPEHRPTHCFFTLVVCFSWHVEDAGVSKTICHETDHLQPLVLTVCNFLKKLIWGGGISSLQFDTFYSPSLHPNSIRDRSMSYTDSWVDTEKAKERVNHHYIYFLVLFIIHIDTKLRVGSGIQFVMLVI